MKRSTRQIGQKVVALVVIVAMLDLVGVAPGIIVFLTGAGIVVWLVARRSEKRETRRIFTFYVSAADILGDEKRHRYEFEVEDAINKGEQILIGLPDAPPLLLFALGALYHRTEEYEAALENLTPILDDKWMQQLHRVSPSPQLRRYVAALRRIESDPSPEPAFKSAVENLESMRRKRAREIWLECREQVLRRQREVDEAAGPISGERLQLNPPPPISDLLSDLYDEEHKAH